MKVAIIVVINISQKKLLETTKTTLKLVSYDCFIHHFIRFFSLNLDYKEYNTHFSNTN